MNISSQAKRLGSCIRPEIRVHAIWLLEESIFLNMAVLSLTAQEAVAIVIEALSRSNAREQHPPDAA